MSLRTELLKFTSSFLRNKFVERGPLRLLVDPCNGSTFGTVHYGTPDIVEESIRSGNYAYHGKNPDQSRPWREYDGGEVREILLNIAKQMEIEKENLAYLESLSGKPFNEGIEDVKSSIEVFRFFAGLADKYHGRYFNTDANSRFFTQKEPIGLCALITSYNYPILLMAWKLAPALAMKNCVVIKPPEDNPLSSLYMGYILSKIRNLPSGVVSIVPGGSELGEFLVSHPKIRKISFTGSPATGAEVLKKAYLKRVTLELGAKNIIVVSKHVDFQRINVADLILDAAFSNIGQNCCAGSKLYIHEDVYERTLNELVGRLRSRRWSTCHTTLPESNYGPLAAERHYVRIRGIIKNAVNDGLTPISGNLDKYQHGFFVEPTVFENVPEDHFIAREEIFGPVLAVMSPYNDLHTVLETQSESHYGLAMGFFSESQTEIQLVTEHADVGMLWVNTYNNIPPQLSFGGRKKSGFGYELGFESLDEFSYSKSVMMKL